jgi:hypothetical protein
VRADDPFRVPCPRCGQLFTKTNSLDAKPYNCGAEACVKAAREFQERFHNIEGDPREADLSDIFVDGWARDGLLDAEATVPAAREVEVQWTERCFRRRGLVLFFAPRSTFIREQAPKPARLLPLLSPIDPLRPFRQHGGETGFLEPVAP